MRVILIEPVQNLGLPGDVVSVKPGYARNFLLPSRKALPATEGRVKQMAHARRIASTRREKLMEDLKGRAELIDGKTLEFEEKVSDAGRLYGSVSARRIAEELAEEFGIIQPDWVQLDEAIKTPGTYEVEVRLTEDLSATITVDVMPEGGVVEEPSSIEEAVEAEEEAAEEERPEEASSSGDEVPSEEDEEETEAEEPEPTA